jgi:LysR family transcriptional regulator, glycine cleavage system transcriptional activator
VQISIQAIENEGQSRQRDQRRKTIIPTDHFKPDFTSPMSPPLPPLESLRVFAACVRHGNFSRAADELALTAAAVSQRIRAMEAQLGVTLFSRHGPKLTATNQARALATRIEQALALMHEAVDACRRIQVPLRVTCAPTFAACWLAPRLADYQGLDGADAIELDASSVVSPPGSFDVAIRSGAGTWPGYRAVKLMDEEGTLMVSPKLLPPQRRRLTIDEALALPLIPDRRWAAWFKLAGVPQAKPRFVAARFPTYELEARAAVQGIGAALLSPTLFADLCERGELVAPFKPRLHGPDGYWLLWKDEGPEPHFVSWLRSQLAAGP